MSVPVVFQFIIRSILPAIAFLMISVANAQTWRSAIYPESWQRPGESVSFYDDKLIQDFSFAGYKRGEQALPEVTGPVFDVTAYGAVPNGGGDSTVAIQNTIDAAAAAGGGVVFVPAGEFRVSPQGVNNFCLRISAANIVLRGAGVREAFLLNTSYEMRNKAVLQISPLSVPTSGSSKITADLDGPTRRIPVDDVSRFSPGGFVRIEWEFTDAWILEHNQQTWWNQTNGRPANARYLREVITTNPAEGWIEVDVPTRYTIKARDNARVIALSGLLSEVGVESLSIGNLQHPGTTWGATDYVDPSKPASDVHGSWLVRMQNVRDSWITDVHSRQAVENTSTCQMLSNGVYVQNSFRITLRDCEMRRSQYGGGGGNGYMYRVHQSNECLLERCIADFSRHGIVISSPGTSGNVFFRCEDRETARSTGHTGGYNTGASGSDNHMHFSHSNLFDQCHAHDSFYTASHRGNSGTVPHGLTSAHAVYWNTTGSGTRYNDIVRSEQGRYGYVIGTSGSRFGATNPTGGNTAPADHLEGIGTGDSLEPPSLYLDQLSRRFVPKLMLSGEVIQMPDNTFTVDAGLTLDGELLEEVISLVWEVVSAPADARFAMSEGVMKKLFTVSRPGSYVITAEGLMAEEALSAMITIEVLPLLGAVRFEHLFPEADSYVQGGEANEGSNFGDRATLQIKDDGAIHVRRESFMRFDLGDIAPESVGVAELHMYLTSAGAGASARTSVVDDNSWDELTLNWLSRPTVQTALVGDWSVPAQAWFVLDAGNAVRSQVAADGKISFRHQIISQPGNAVYAMASRENSNPEIHPFLRLEIPAGGLDQWLAENSELKEHERGPLDDPDGDRIPNLLEAWLGTDASSPDSGVLPQIALVDGEVEISVSINTALPGGLVYFLEYSETLGPDDWYLALGARWETTGPESDGRIPTTVRVPEGLTTERMFYRVKVEID